MQFNRQRKHWTCHFTREEMKGLQMGRMEEREAAPRAAAETHAAARDCCARLGKSQTRQHALLAVHRPGSWCANLAMHACLPIFTALQREAVIHKK